MLRITFALALVALLACGAAAQAEPPNPIDAITKVIKAYAAYESGRGDTEIDIQGSTDWYRKYFISYSALKLDYDMSPPEVVSSKRASKDVRLSTLMCPYVPSLSYVCQLDATVIRGSGSTTTHSSQWNVGGTTKQTFMYGVEFLGTGGKIGPTAQFSFAWTRNTGTVDATTDQATNTGTQLLTVDPAQASCYELTGYMAKATQTGRTKLMAVYTEWVGFHNGDSTWWKDDQEKHYFRLRNIWDIVRTAKEAGLKEAEGFDAGYIDKYGWGVTYSNTFDTDFFLGSEGRGTNKPYANSSNECAQMLPGGWDSWLPAVNPSGSAAARGRRLAGHLSARLLPNTLRAVDAHGNTVLQQEAVPAHRSLQGAEPEGGATPARLWNCPHRARHHSVHNNLTILENPTCRGAGFAAFQQRMAAVRRAAAARRRHCVLAARLAPLQRPTSLPARSASGSPKPFDPDHLKRNHTLLVKRLNTRCRFQATPTAELDARDAARARASANKPRAGEPGDYNSKLVRLVQAVCFAETGVNCDVDYTGTSDWYKQYFSAYPPVNGVVGADDIKMAQSTDFSATSSSWFCAYINASTTCQAASADMTSKAHTDSTTTSWNFQFKLGFKIKAQASFLGIGPTAEYETENTVDWGYSFSDGSSTTTTDGASTTSTVKIPLTGAMNKCAKINLITRKASAKGSSRAWVCADGWVGTHQHPNRNWPDVDASGESHYYRAFTLSYIVDLAQRKNLNAGDAFDWFIDGQGRACLYNAVDMSFEQGVMSFVRPQLYDKDSADCSPAALGISEARLFPATVSNTTSDITYDAIPMSQDVPCEWPC